MARPKVIDADSAGTIARKLDGDFAEGRKHTNVVIRIDGTYIGRFGLRRGRNTSHNYIPAQIGTTMQVALGLARCSLYKSDYVASLRERGVLPSPPDPECGSG